MAAPTTTQLWAGSSKTTGTSVASSSNSQTLSVGTYLSAVLALDATAGTVTFATTGTAVLGSWVVDEDVTVGSGTSGSRLVCAHARVTTAGTVNTVTATHPSVAARSLLGVDVVGADSSTPVLVHGSSTATAAPTVAVTAGRDVLIVNFAGDQAANGTAFTGAVDPAGWTAAAVTANYVGTSGGGGASNIVAGGRSWSRTSTVAESIAPQVDSAADCWVTVAFQATPAAGPLTLTDTAGGARAGVPADRLTLGLTKTDTATAARAGGPGESLSFPATSPLTVTDRATSARTGTPLDLLTFGLTRTDTASASRAGAPRDTVTFGLTRTDAPAGGRAAGPREALTFGLTRSDTAGGSRAAGPADTLTFGLTRTDSPGAGRAGTPTGTITFGLTLADTAAAVRAGVPVDLLNLTGAAPFTLTDRPGAARAAGTRDTATFGLIIVDRPLAVRGGDGADLPVFGLTILDRSSGVVRLAAPSDTLTLPSGAPLTVVQLRGTSTRTLTHGISTATPPTGSSGPPGHPHGTSTHNSTLTGRDA